MASPGCASHLRRPTCCGSICCYNTPTHDALVRRVLITTAWKDPGLETCFPGFDRQERRQRGAYASLGGVAARLRVCRARLRARAALGISAWLTVAGRAGSGYRLLLVARKVHFRLPSPGCLPSRLRRRLRGPERLSPLRFDGGDEPVAANFTVVSAVPRCATSGGTRSPHEGRTPGLHE